MPTEEVRMDEVKKESRFNWVELSVIVAVIGLIISITIPGFRSMQQESSLTKVEGDLDTLKIAVTAYWKNHSQAFPANVHKALTASTPAVITETLTDPWGSDTVNNTYGYVRGTDKTFGEYFFIYTKGPKGDTNPSWDADNQRVTYTGTGYVVSNAPIVKE